MKIAFLTLGCKVNQYEADSLAQSLRERGHEIAPNLDESVDIVFLSTCAVTNEAERKSRQMISKIKKECPNAKIMVCGCASQHNPKNFDGKDGVMSIVGTSGKEWLLDMLDQKACYVIDAPYDYEEMTSPKKHRTRSYLKIQDGCNNFCSYCLIPYLRGRSRSRNLESIVVEAFNMAKESKEIVITGIDVSSWGEDLNCDIISLVESLKTIRARIRFSSMEAKIITKDFLEALKNMPNFCPHFHLSMQSGANKTLKDMNRKYTKEEFLDKVFMIKKAFPNCAITTDLIVGFPTETEEDFKETLETVKKAEFADMHIFPYSKRDGTAAARFKMIDGEIVKERIERVTRLKNELHQKFLSSQMGLYHEVLLEQEVNGYLVGHSQNFSKVYVKKGDLKPNDMVAVKIVGLWEDGLLGEFIQKC